MLHFIDHKHARKCSPLGPVHSVSASLTRQLVQFWFVPIASKCIKPEEAQHPWTSMIQTGSLSFPHLSESVEQWDGGWVPAWCLEDLPTDPSPFRLSVILKHMQKWSIVKFMTERILCQGWKLDSGKQERPAPGGLDSTEDCRSSTERPWLCLCWLLAEEDEIHYHRLNSSGLIVPLPSARRNCTLRTWTTNLWNRFFSQVLAYKPKPPLQFLTSNTWADWGSVPKIWII